MKLLKLSIVGCVLAAAMSFGQDPALVEQAEKGDAEAQSNLGAMYYDGNGVTQDFAKALEWHTKAADQGDTNSQFALAKMYFFGRGAPKNNVLAHMWFTIVLSGTDRDLASAVPESLQMVAKKMSPDDIKQAQALANEKLSQIRARQAKQ